MSVVSFDQYIDCLFVDKEYGELFRILNVCDYTKLDNSLLNIMAVTCYKLKKHNTCIMLCKFLIERGYTSDYFIFEILAESSYQKNELQESLDSYNLALSLRPSLKQASYRKLLLDYRLNGVLDEILMSTILDSSLKSGNINYLRSIAYVFINENRIEEAYDILEKIINLSKNKYYPDLLSVSIIIKSIISSKFFLKSEALREKLDFYEKSLDKSVFNSKFESNNSDTLFITLAPASGFLFQKYKYDSDKLFLVDGTGTYFILSYEKIVVFIVDLIKKHKYKQISIAGSSKGGTAVILVLNKLQKIFPKIQIKAVAFSPQIKLWPFNSNLTIPSYRVLSEYIHTNPFLRDAFVKASHDISFNIIPNNKLTVFYGNKFKMDEVEAGYILNKSDQVDIIELDYSGHGTSIPLTIPENKTEEDLRKTYANLPIDPDFAELGGDKLVDIVDEIFAIYSNPEMRLHKFLC